MAIGLYIHVPFCVKKCNYCDFISYPYDAGLTASYVSALLKEIELYGQQLSGKDKELASVYIGGEPLRCCLYPSWKPFLAI
ncbi:MAG: hypothetical protein Kow00111_12890 [Thermincola ferriacetica]